MRASIFAILVAVSACKPPAQLTLDDYLRAVDHKDLGRAYALMSADYRRDHDRSAFERDVARAPASKRSRQPSRVTYTADVVLPGFPSVKMVWEDGHWRLGRDPLDTFPQDTPDAALRSFLRAVEAERWEVVLRFVPQRYRAGMTVDALRSRWGALAPEDLKRQLMEAHRHLQPEAFELSNGGDEARAQLGDRKQIRLVREREDNLWKVEALE